MKDYLKKNKNNYIGYIGQPDTRDNRSKNQETKLRSQRRRLYHLITIQAFVFPFYEITAEEFYTEVNLRLIRKIVTKNKKKRSVKQKNSFDKFKSIFEENQTELIQFMTDAQKEISVIQEEEVL